MPAPNVEPLTLVARYADDSLVIEARGELDLYSAPHLRDALAAAADAGEPRVVLDMGPTTFVDSTGLGVLLDAHHRLSQAGASLLLANPSRAVVRLVELTGLLGVLRIEGRQPDG